MESKDYFDRPGGPKVLAYARVSTARDQSTDAQIAELRAFCIARGWQISKEICDHGYSGGTDERPGLKKLLALVRTRQVDVVLVTKMDRLFRSLRHLVNVLEEFANLGVVFTATRDSIDWSTPSGRMFTQVLGALAEFERGLIRERTRVGLAHARSQGKTLGRPRRGLEGEIARLRAGGASYRAIRRQLRCSMGSIRRALTAPNSSFAYGVELPETTEAARA